MGVAGGAIVGDSIQAGCFDHDGPIRAVLTVLAPAGMAAAGGVLGGLTGRMRGSSWALLSGLLTLAMGGLVGGLVGIACWPSLNGLAMGARDGIGYGAGVAVASGPVLFLTHRLGRVRAGSVAASSRQMTTWCAAGLSIAAGAALAAVASKPFAQCIRASDSPTALDILASVGAFVSLVGAGASAMIWLRGRALCAYRLEPSLRPSRDPVAGEGRVDFGIGEGLWETPGHESPYRDGCPREAVFAGNPLEALASLNVDVIYAGLCALCALAIAALSFASTPVKAAPAAIRQDSPWYPVPIQSAASRPRRDHGVP
jgi:hypothetical protein